MSAGIIIPSMLKISFSLKCVYYTGSVSLPEGYRVIKARFYVSYRWRAAAPEECEAGCFRSQPAAVPGLRTVQLASCPGARWRASDLKL